MSDSYVRIDSFSGGTLSTYVSSREQSFITGKTVVLAIGVILAIGIMVASPFVFHDLGLRHLYLIGPEVGGRRSIQHHIHSLSLFEKTFNKKRRAAYEGFNRIRLYSR